MPPGRTGFCCSRSWMAMQAVSAWPSSGKTTKSPSPSSLTTRPLCCSKILARAVVSWVTKRPAVSSPSRSKMPVLPTRSANTTEAMRNHYAPRVMQTKKPVGPEDQPAARVVVGVAGFELATPCTPCKCATRLRYTPKPSIISGAPVPLVRIGEQVANLEEFAAHEQHLLREDVLLFGRHAVFEVVHGGVFDLDDFDAFEI